MSGVTCPNRDPVTCEVVEQHAKFVVAADLAGRVHRLGCKDPHGEASRLQGVSTRAFPRKLSSDLGLGQVEPLRDRGTSLIRDLVGPAGR